MLQYSYHPVASDEYCLLFLSYVVVPAVIVFYNFLSIQVVIYLVCVELTICTQLVFHDFGTH